MIKEIFTKMGWSRKSQATDSSVLLKNFRDSDGLESGETPYGTIPHANPMVAKKKDSVEVFNEAVEKLVGKLENINENLSSQVQQNQQLVERMNTLPELLMPLPKAVAEQREAFAQVAEQLRQKVARDEKVAEHLSGIHEKVAQAADVDAKLCDHFSAFSETLHKLGNDTVSQTEWLQQMNQTFLATEHYVKAALAKQQTRFYWVLGISLGMSFLAVAGMIVGIYLLRG